MFCLKHLLFFVVIYESHYFFSTFFYEFLEYMVYIV